MGTGNALITDQGPRLTDALVEGGVAVISNFLNPKELTGLRVEFDRLRGEGSFRRAATGHGPSRALRDDIRGDEISWLGSPLNAAQESLTQRLEEIRSELNRSLFLGLKDWEGHFAYYPPGSFYRRHVDRFDDDDLRVVSLVLYLNETWNPEWGGELGLFDPRRLIAPEPGRLVCFMSDRIAHEVCESKAERRSFAGWFRRGALPGFKKRQKKAPDPSDPGLSQKD